MTDTKTNPYTLPGVNVLLLGAPGSGKTDALATLLEAGIEVFCIFTEPGMETLFSSLRRRGISTDKLHWRYVPPAAPSFSAMIDAATKMNSFSQSALQKMDGMNKSEYVQLIEVLKLLANYIDQTGASFGSVDTWDASCALVVDSLSGINTMAMDLVAGGKPMKSMPDWGMAMDTLSRLIAKLCGDTRCHFILCGHLEPEKDEVTGRITLMASTLGKKLAPTIPRFFSDVVLAYREGDKFYWSTVEANVDLKPRNLPFSAKLTPSFVPVIESWKKNAADA